VSLARSDSRRAVEVAIDHHKLVIIVLIRTLVGAWVIRVIHAGAKVAVIKGFILVIQAESVTDLLTRDHLPPRRRIVLRCVEVGVIQLDRSLSHVVADRPSGPARQAQIAMERYRELTTFGGILDSSSLAKAREALSRPLIDESTRRALEEASAGMSALLRLPEFDEFQKVQKRLTKTFALIAPQPTLDVVKRSMEAFESIRTPWVNKRDALRSLDSFTGLATLASNIHLAPYAPATITTVRHALGDWSSMPDEIQQDSIRRDAFYEEHGLDPTLVAILTATELP
jgi:hypothetical protein